MTGASIHCTFSRTVRERFVAEAARGLLNQEKVYCDRGCYEDYLAEAQALRGAIYLDGAINSNELVGGRDVGESDRATGICW